MDGILIMKNSQKVIAPIIMVLIVAVILGGVYLLVRQQGNKKTEVPIISADVFKNAVYRIVFPGKDVTPPREFTMIDGFAQNIDKVEGGCNIVDAISNKYLHPDSKELLVATIDQSGNKGVVAVYCNYGASANDIFFVAFKNLNGVPAQTDAVDLRKHPDLQSRNLYRVGVKQIALDANGVLTVTALVVPDALRNAPGVQQNASESVAISYSLDNQGKLISTPTLTIDSTNQKILSSLVTNWKKIGHDIIPGFPDPSKTFYGYPYIIQFIGNNRIVIAYENDSNPLFAVLSYDPAQQKFSYLDKHGSPDFELNETLWNVWRNKYGDISVTPQSYKYSSTRTGDAVILSDWKPIIENPFASLPSPAVTTDWKTYTNEKYGFSVQYPTGTQIDLSDTSSKKVGFQPITTKGNLSIDVIQSSANCFDTTSGADPTYKTIGGINFTVWSESKGYSTGSDTWASAVRYCTARNGYEYNLIAKLSYKASTTPLDVDKDAVLNQILSTFRFTQNSSVTTQ